MSFIRLFFLPGINVIMTLLRYRTLLHYSMPFTYEGKRLAQC